MAKVFSEVLSGEQSVPVWDVSAHTEIGSLSGSLTSHSANNDVHVTLADKANWDQKVDSGTLNEYATTANLNSLSSEFTSYSGSVADSIANGKNAYEYLTANSANVEGSANSGKEAYDWITANSADLEGSAQSGKEAYDWVGSNSSRLADLETSAQSGIDALSWVETNSGRLDNFETSASDLASSAQSGVDAYDWIETNSATLTVNADNGYSAYQWICDEGPTILHGVEAAEAASSWIDSNYARIDDLETAASNFETSASDLASSAEYGIAASAWIDNFTPQKLSAGNYIDISDNLINVSGLDEIINGTNNVSAEWNEETKQWDIGLEKEKIAFARYTTNTIVNETAGEVIISGLQEAERYDDKITKNTAADAIILKPGLYHADVKTIISVTAPVATYNEVKLICTTAPERNTIIDLDHSYIHNESIQLSFDVMIKDEHSVQLKFESLPTGVSYQLSYFNIHEIVNVAGILNDTAQGIVAGDGLSKDGNTLSVKAGAGLKLVNGEVKVAVGKGLKIEEDELTAALNVSLDTATEETVQEVQEMSNDLDEKVTTTYSYANITSISDLSSVGETHNGNLIRYLFSVPIKNAIYVEGKNAVDKVTTVGVYASQVYTQNYVILGIYEYDPEFVYSDGRKGRTVAFCDTGRVTLIKGYNEFTMKHFNSNNETEPYFKSGCLYYASIYVSKNAGEGGILLATCPGYDAAFHANPQLTMIQENVEIDLNAEGKEDTSFNDFGWGENAYNELPSCPRVFMTFRNKKIS